METGSGKEYRTPEPVTALTDFVIAGACTWFAFWLADEIGVRLAWVVGFAMGAVSAIAGGIYHGLPSVGEKSVRERLWTLTLLAIGASCCAFAAGAMLVSFPQVPDTWIEILAGLAFVGYAMIVAREATFGIAGRATVVTLIAFAIMAVSLARRGNSTGALLITGNVVLTLVGVAVQMRNVAPHPRFNHNDLFHAFQLAALFCLYFGVKSLS